MTIPPTLRESAVLVPVFRDAAGEANLVLVHRSSYGVHGGQLAFPGGKRESADASLLATALRETEEEIGLPRAAIDVLAALPPVYTRSSGFHIAPFLARISPPPTWHYQPTEIAEVLQVPLSHLADPANAGQESWQLPGWPAPELVDFGRVGPHYLWGATYRIVHALLPRLLAGEWEL
ncbi:NUDIX hydrolase [Hymenobacter bucti]|uniref:NUDIX hydrolase n=1 Tax=Hymenobacter bucti TaxID=1844114 RepID=A0ABW4QRA6_9BACT